MNAVRIINFNTLHCICSPVTTGALIAAGVLLLWLLYRKKCFSFFKEHGIPGPEPSLLFGNLLELAMKNPLKCLDEWFQKYGNIVGLYYGTRPCVLIKDVDLLRRIQISDFHKFMNRPILLDRISGKNVDKNKPPFSQNLQLLKDQKWKEIRSVITSFFTASKIKQLVPVMNAAIDTLMSEVEEKCKAGEEFDIYPMYQDLTLDIIARTGFGIQMNDHWLQTIKILFSEDITNPVFILSKCFRSLRIIWNWMYKIRYVLLTKGTYPLKEFFKYVELIITNRRKNKEIRRVDLLQLMLDTQTGNLPQPTSKDGATKGNDSDENVCKGLSSTKLIWPMTDIEILDNSAMFFIVAYETTSSALAFTTHLLMHHPEAQDKIRQEVRDLSEAEVELNYYSVNQLKYLDQVLHESLRMYPPIYLFIGRECGKDIDLGKIKLKKGMAIQVPAWSLHMDPELWGSDVHEFRPERFSPENKRKIHPMAFQAFGQGPRNCIGMRFGLMEAKLALARLLSKYHLEPCSKINKRYLDLRFKLVSMNPKYGTWVKAIPV